LRTEIFPTRSNASDVLVIGGGPAGLAAAIALRQHGLDVAIAGALIPPISAME
jgi:2-polyprenyl-6-methoxyphenol hydroxylase-like FAD-dependent oxidoreductase